MSPKPVPVRFHFILAAAIWLLGAGASLYLGFSQHLENQWHDWTLRQDAGRRPPDPRIVILDIDEATLAAMSGEYGRYPWTRAVFGTLLQGLARQQPAAAVFDILFTDPHRDHAEDDRYFMNTVRAMDNVYFPLVRLPSTPGGDRATGFPLALLPGALPPPDQTRPDARARLLLPLAGLMEGGRIGAINIDADRDGVIRRYPIHMDVEGWRIPSLPARVAGGLGVPPPAGMSSLPLAWHGPAQSYAFISFHDFYSDLERRRPRRPANEFKDKIVLIGSTAPGLHDLKLTPMGDGFPAVEIIATALDNLLNHDRVQPAPAWLAPAIMAPVMASLAAGLALGTGPLRLGLGLLAATGAASAASWGAMLSLRLAVPVVMPMLFGWIYYLVATVHSYLGERRERRRVTRLFGRFLDPRVVSRLVADGETAASLSGQRRVVTVLFSDIRGFTALAEKKSPQEIVELLNRYYALQVEVIFRHQGTLDKYIGDAIMAFWGAPADQLDHAARALRAAHDMEAALHRFRRELGRAGEDFDIGIGIHTGEVVVGFIGSARHRQDYTVVGDTVNAASRIEGETRGRCRVLVSEATHDACGDVFRFTDHGRIKLKGRTEEIHLYEPRWN